MRLRKGDHCARAYPVSVTWNNWEYQYHCTSLDRIWIHCKTTPSNLSGHRKTLPVYIKTPTVGGERAFSFPETAILLVSTENGNFWPDPIFWASAEYSFHIFSQSDFCRFGRKSNNHGLLVFELPRHHNCWSWPQGLQPLGMAIVREAVWDCYLLPKKWKTTAAALKPTQFEPEFDMLSTRLQPLPNRLRTTTHSLVWLTRHFTDRLNVNALNDFFDLVDMFLTLVCSFLRSFIIWKSSGFLSFFSRSCLAFSETNVIHFLIAWSLVL